MRMTIFYFLGTNPILSEMRFTAAPDCAAIANRAPFNLRDMALSQIPSVQSLRSTQLNFSRRPPCTTYLTSSIPMQITAYHPKSNSLVVCFHHSLKDAVQALFAAVNWMDHLPWVLMNLHSAAREDDKTTPTKAVFGSPLM